MILYFEPQFFSLILDIQIQNSRFYHIKKAAYCRFFIILS